MSSAPSPAPATPPSLITALQAGFDAVANHLSVILLPVLLDLFLWAGPRLKIQGLLQALINQMFRLPAAGNAEMAALLRANQELWQQAASRLNLLSILRTYPVGIPSLMAGRLPLASPLGQPPAWEVGSWSGVLIFWLALLTVGLTLGSLYFSATAQAALQGELHWPAVLRAWPWTAWQVLSLTILWGLLLLGMSIPVSLTLALVSAAGSWLGQLILFLLGGFLIWLALPLLFSPHGIFVYRQRMLASVSHGVRLAQMTLPSTGLFFLAALVISQGLDVLWQVPGEASWFGLVGVIGHAFVATAVLAASFIYYRDADRWLRQIFNPGLARPKT